MSNPKSSFKKLAVEAARIGDAKKAHPALVYDLGGKSTLADYVVLLGAESAPQLEAIEEEIVVQMKHQGIYCLHKDGMRSKNWKVLDYGGTLIHIYDGKAAEFYAIDKVYSGYKPVEWMEPAPAPAPVKKAPAPKKAPVKKAAAKPAKKAAKPVKKAAKKPVKKTAKKPVKKAAKKTAKKTAKKK
jgi:ribosome silencing factor RsfS/YbeB/iojap